MLNLMKIILFGASGMVGQGVLRECVLSTDVESILLVGRASIKESKFGKSSFLTPYLEGPKQKVYEVITSDLNDLSPHAEALSDYDACFFCLGITSAGLSEEQYRIVTYDLTLAVAHALAKPNSKMTFIYVSGTGTDSTESGRTMWARVKGKTENDILKLPFKAKYMFRPGYIQPANGETSKVSWYKYVYVFLSPLYPLVKLIAPNMVTSTELVGRAMIYAAKAGAPKTFLESRDINFLAAQASTDNTSKSF